MAQYLEDNYNFIPSVVREYSIAIINAIKNRFPEYELYNAFSIFDPKELPDNERDLFIYGTIEIEDKYVVNFVELLKKES